MIHTSFIIQCRSNHKCSDSPLPISAFGPHQFILLLTISNALLITGIPVNSTLQLIQYIFAVQIVSSIELISFPLKRNTLSCFTVPNSHIILLYSKSPTNTIIMLFFSSFSLSRVLTRTNYSLQSIAYLEAICTFNKASSRVLPITTSTHDLEHAYLAYWDTSQKMGLSISALHTSGNNVRRSSIHQQ